MGRYIVFAYEKYYPLGGWDDLIFGPTDDLVKAKHAAKVAVCQRDPFDYAEVIDVSLSEVVYETMQGKSTQDEKDALRASGETVETFYSKRWRETPRKNRLTELGPKV